MTDNNADPYDLPELETIVGMAGGMTRAEVGGLACLNIPILMPMTTERP